MAAREWRRESGGARVAAVTLTFIPKTIRLGIFNRLPEDSQWIFLKSQFCSIIGQELSTQMNVRLIIHLPNQGG
jgi:hypothetical protein